MRFILSFLTLILVSGCALSHKMAVMSYDEDLANRLAAGTPGAKEVKHENCEPQIFGVITELPEPYKSLNALQKDAPGMVFVNGAEYNYYWMIPVFYARHCAGFKGTPVNL